MREIGTDQAPFTRQNNPKPICWWILKWKDNRRWTLSLEEALWIMDSYFHQKQTQTLSFWLLKMLIAGLEWSGLLWCIYQLFGLSFWRHPFTAEDPLVSKWCNATFLQICSHEQTNSWMAWGWAHFFQQTNVTCALIHNSAWLSSLHMIIFLF